MSKTDTDHALTFALAGRLFSMRIGTEHQVVAILEVQHGGTMTVVRVLRAGESWVASQDEHGSPIFQSLPIETLADRAPLVVHDQSLRVGELELRLPVQLLLDLRGRMKGR